MKGKHLGLMVAAICGCAADDPAPPACAPDAVDGIAVAHTDVYGAAPFAMGYPPYALDGCTLAYVSRPAAGQAAGELLLRDLQSGEETLIAPAEEAPRRPALSGGVLAWEASVDGADVVRVRSQGTIVTAAGDFFAAREPRACGDAVVFTGWRGPAASDDTDIFLLPIGATEASMLAGGPGQQRFADVSLAHVAYSDFAEDPDGRFDEGMPNLADIGVVDRAQGTAFTRQLPGKQAFPLVAEDRLAYLHWEGIPPEPKIGEYDLHIGTIGDPPADDATLDHVVTVAPYIRPTANEALVEWVQWPQDSPAVLWRGGLDGAVAPHAVVSASELFGPVAASSMTVYAARGADGLLVLEAAAR